MLYSFPPQAFLIFDGLDRNEWAPKLDESRDAYRALRDHFLKYIEHPDDLESTVDPLADDEQVGVLAPRSLFRGYDGKKLCLVDSSLHDP